MSGLNSSDTGSSPVSEAKRPITLMGNNGETFFAFIGLATVVWDTVVFCGVV